jgi:methionyl aminopeptidase
LKYGSLTWQKTTGWCLEGSKIIEICQKGDQLLDEEIAKVYKGKKISKGLQTLVDIARV